MNYKGRCEGSTFRCLLATGRPWCDTLWQRGMGGGGRWSTERYVTPKIIYMYNINYNFYCHLIIIWLRTSIYNAKNFASKPSICLKQKVFISKRICRGPWVCLKLEISEEESQSLKNKTNRVNKNGPLSFFGFFPLACVLAAQSIIILLTCQPISVLLSVDGRQVTWNTIYNNIAGLSANLTPQPSMHNYIGRQNNILVSSL